MKSFVIRITDAASVDRQIVVMVVEPAEIGHVAQMALDQVSDEVGVEMKFPVFVDIHAAEEFGNVGWMHPKQS